MHPRSGCGKMSDFTLLGCKLETIIVAYSCIALTACCECLSMVSRERPRKQIGRSSTNNALKMSLAIHEGSSDRSTSQQGHHQLEHLPLGRIHQSMVPILTLSLWYFRYSDTKTGSLPLRPILWRSRMMPYCFIGLFQVKEEANFLLPLCKGILEISFQTHPVVGRATMFSEATRASV